jgi:hypothetical protein
LYLQSGSVPLGMKINFFHHMKKAILPLLLILLLAGPVLGQSNIDTLAIQDFEVVPQAPTWTFTGPVIYNSGFSSGTAAPPNSPIGIGGSRAWETTTNSGGLILEFANIPIPTIYDSVRVHFNLAAMNLAGASGGPDNLDYVLVAYSTDGGTTYVNRLRIRGASTDNSFWAYSATGVAKVLYTPATETMFQPTTSGLQTTLGYSNCEIVFPGSVTQVRIRITGRSSSSTDTWLVDNLVITGENNCIPSTATISPTACDSYTSPSGNHTWTSSGTYQDTINNTTGCDSILTINLSILNSSSTSFAAAACYSYTSPSGNHTWTSSGLYADTLQNTLGCDSILAISLTINGTTGGSITGTYCDSLRSPSGNHLWTTSGVFYDTIPNTAGCDSIILANIVVNSSSSGNLTATGCGSYVAPSGVVYTASGIYTDVIPNTGGCDSVITITLTMIQVNTAVTLSGNTLTASASGALYQWIDCDNGNTPISGATQQAFSPATSGNYAVIVTNNSCSDTSACTNVTVVGSAAPLNQHMSVLPNPAVSHLVITVPVGMEFAQFQISDLSGKVIVRGNLSGPRTELSVADLAAGTYHLQVQGQSQPALRFTKIE